ncbi:MAG: matrixin family metalloprotease [Solirubrobacterales bacterium]|nr:matrixin family metalloprotease [Solirubrobacterales bacterium]
MAVQAPALGAEGKGPRVVSALGTTQVGARAVLVDVVVVVPRGQNVRAAKRAALKRQGARPIGSAALGSAGFTLTGLVWDTPPATQNYNPANERVAALPALQNTHTTWNGVENSLFGITYGGETSRCPSLVQQCSGPQTFDTNNDTGWLRLDRRTLAVAWFGTSTDEVDIAANTRFNWHQTCGNVKKSYDIETVLGHENGHFVGLGHSKDISALMYPSYQGARCSLAGDDAEGARYLYPTQTATVEGTVTDGSGPVKGAEVALAVTPFSATTDSGGNYSMSGVPYTVTYDVTASKGSLSSTTRVQVNSGSFTNLDFVLKASDGDGGGGGGPPCSKKPDHPNCNSNK